MSQCNSEIVCREPRPGAKEVGPMDFPRIGSTDMTESIVVPRKQATVLDIGFLQKIST